MSFIRNKTVIGLMLFSFVLIGVGISTLCSAENSLSDDKRHENYKIRQEKENELWKELKLNKDENSLVVLWKKTKDPRILKYFEDCLGINNGDSFEAIDMARALIEMMNTKESKDVLKRGMKKYKAIRGYGAVLLSLNGEAEKYGPVIVEEKAYKYCRDYNELIPYLAQGLKDEDPDIRSGIVNMLSGAEGYNNNGDDNKGTLKKVSLELLKSNSPKARYFSAKYLHRVMKKEAIPYLKDALKDYPLSSKIKDESYSLDSFQQLIKSIEENEGKDGAK